MNKQEPGGPLPPDPTNGTATAPDSLEQQLEKERQARVLIRDRLRHTEALAAESHALRSAMAQELEKVTADRDRLRAEAATSGTAATASASANAATTPPSFGASGSPVEPSMTFVPPTTPPAASNIGERPLAPPPRRGPWRALAMLGGLAAGVAFLAWLNGSMPSIAELASTSAPTSTATSPETAKPEAPAARTEAAAASVPLAAAKNAPALATTGASPTGAVPLPPLPPEAQLAAAPTAAGPAPSVPAAAQVDLAPRLRKALDGEGISAPVAVDTASGHVVVSDPKPDPALRDRTDMLIRAVYAGASLPEPQIEHRWLTPKRGEQVTSMSPTLSAPASAAASAPDSALSPAAAYLARHPLATSTSTATPAPVPTSTRVVERAKKPGDVSVADAEELRPVLPAGHLTAACMEGLAGKTTARRAGLTACMKHSCCSNAASLNSEECRAYTKAYPFTCSGG